MPLTHRNTCETKNGRLIEIRLEENYEIIDDNGNYTNQEDIMETKMYMNVETGSVDDYDGWWYEDDDGTEVNAVDQGEVVKVVRNAYGYYVEAKEVP